MATNNEKALELLEFQLKNGRISVEEAKQRLQEMFPDAKVVKVEYRYNRVGNSYGAKLPFVYEEKRWPHREPLASVDIFHREESGGTPGSLTFSRRKVESDMLWVISSGAHIEYHYPYAE